MGAAHSRYGEELALNDEPAFRQTEDANRQTVVVVGEAAIRRMIDQVLDEAGYTVINGPDGAAASRFRDRGADRTAHHGCRLAGRHERTAGRRCGAGVTAPGAKVLFINDYAANATAGNGHREPGMALLTKPFSMKALAAKAGAIMNARGSSSRC